MGEPPEQFWIDGRFSSPLDDEWRDLGTAHWLESSAPVLPFALMTHILWCATQCRLRATCGLRIWLIDPEPLVQLSKEATNLPAVLEEHGVGSVPFERRPPTLVRAGTAFRIEVRRSDALPIDQVRVEICGYQVHERSLEATERAVRKFGELGCGKVLAELRKDSRTAVA